MKQKILSSILLLTVWQSLVWGEGDSCLFPTERSHIEEGLHYLWAQEYTGADLLREKLKESTQWEVSYNLVQIWDDPLIDHGEHVSNLIASPHPTATIPLEHPIDYIKFEHLNHKTTIHDSFMRCREENSCPAYINISMWFPPLSKEGLDVVDLIANTKISVVSSAGNSPILKLINPIEQEYARKKGIISVGNCGTDGNPHPSSSYFPEITICAPSGHNITSYNFKGDIKTFGGTSGAAPQVTAALATFTAITGYALNPGESIKMLEQTAIPHPLLPSSSNMGVGMVNTWKIGAVAFRLRELCQENKTCYARSLQSEDVFKFFVDKEILLQRASEIYPTCMGRKRDRGSIQDKKNLLKDLRKGVLLDPYEGQLWSLIACINRKMCLDKHADYYESLANRTGKNNRELIQDLWDSRQYDFVFKYFSLMHQETRELLTNQYLLLLEEENIDIRILVDLYKSLLDSAVIAFVSERLFEKIITHPKIDAMGLGDIGEAIAENAKKIPAHKKLLEMTITHLNINSNELRWIGDAIAKNAENIYDHERLLAMFITHLKIDSELLQWIGKAIAENAENIPEHNRLLKMFITHLKINPKLLQWIGKAIAENAENIYDHNKLLKMIITHLNPEPRALRLTVEAIAENAENISDHNKFLKILITHPSIASKGLGNIGAAIAKNTENIPAYEKLLEMIITHAKISARILELIGTVVAQKASIISDHEKFLQMITTHPKINAWGLEWVGAAIAKNAENISAHERFLQIIIAHSKIDVHGLMWIEGSIFGNKENIPAHKTILEAITDRKKSFMENDISQNTNRQMVDDTRS